MAEGIVSLRKTQFGRESTAGTAVVATSVQRLMSNGAKDDSPVEFINEHIGYLPQINRTAQHHSQKRPRQLLLTTAP